MERACQRGGHETVCIKRVSEGLAFLKSKDHVDVVVTSVHLENDNVFELLREINTKPEHSHVRVIMVCENLSEHALAMHESTKRAAELVGCDAYLVMRSFDAEQLLKEIDVLLPDLPAKETNLRAAY